MSAISGTTSSQNQVWLEICGCHRLVECADLTEVNDSYGGKLQSEGAIQQSNGKAYELNRWRTFQPSTTILTLPLDSANYLVKLRDKDCLTSLQVRTCDKQWQRIMHYTGVQVDSFRISNLTASGIGAQDAVPMVSVPIVYSRLYNITREKPVEIDAGDNQIDETVYGVAYCDCASCCEGCADNCDRLYRVRQGGILDTSSDGGRNWAKLNHCLPPSFEGIWCMGGRVFVSTFGYGLYYSDTPMIAESWLPTGQTLGVVGDVLRGSLVLYALSRHEDQVIIYKSIDEGISWQESYRFLGDYVGAAAEGRWIALVGDRGAIAISSDGGMSWRNHTMQVGASKPDLVAVDIALPDFRNQGCMTLYVATQSNDIYLSSDLSNWRKTKAGNGGSERYQRAYLFVEMEGGLIWYHRVINGVPTTWKNAGDCCEWVDSSFPVSEGMCDTVPLECAMYTCFDDDCNISLLFRCPSAEIPEELAGEILYGCVTDTEVLIATCGDCPADFVGQPNACSFCEGDPQCVGDERDCENCSGCPVSSETTMPHCPPALPVLGCRMSTGASTGNSATACCPEGPDLEELFCNIQIDGAEDYVLIGGMGTTVDGEEVCILYSCDACPAPEFVSCSSLDEEDGEEWTLTGEQVEGLIGDMVALPDGSILLGQCGNEEGELVLFTCGSDFYSTDFVSCGVAEEGDTTEWTLTGEQVEILGAGGVGMPNGHYLLGKVENDGTLSFLTCGEPPACWGGECFENEYLPPVYTEVPVGQLALLGESCYLESPCDSTEFLTMCDDNQPLTSMCSSGCPEGCEKQVNCGVYSVFAICPSDPNIAIAIGSEVLLSV